MDVSCSTRRPVFSSRNSRISEGHVSPIMVFLRGRLARPPRHEDPKNTKDRGRFSLCPLSLSAFVVRSSVNCIAETRGARRQAHSQPGQDAIPFVDPAFFCQAGSREGRARRLLDGERQRRVLADDTRRRALHADRQPGDERLLDFERRAVERERVLQRNVAVLGIEPQRAPRQAQAGEVVGVVEVDDGRLRRPARPRWRRPCRDTAGGRRTPARAPGAARR